MPKAHLTDLTVQKLKPGMYFDSKTPAFGIRIGKNRRTWLVVKGHTRTKVRLGHYPAMSLAEARNRALVALGSPMQEKVQISFKDALTAFLALPRWRPRSKVVLQSSLRHFTWKRNLDKITHEDVAQALEAIKSPSARAHALKDIRTFFNWTIPRYLDASPAAGLKMEKQKSRDRVLTPEELKAVWKASHDLGRYGTIVRLLILTAQRRNEIASLKPEWIKDSTITIPAAIAKNGRVHTFPIGPLTEATITELTREPFDWQRSKKKLDKLSAVTDWVIHDLRRTAATRHAELGTPIHVIEKLLNHVSGSLAGVSGIYNRYSYEKEMREAVTRYEAYITELVK